MPRPTTHIPVKVLPSTPRPTPAAPVLPATSPITPSAPKKKEHIRREKPAQTEAQKRRLMWLIVILGSSIALAGMILLWPLQMKNGKHDTIFGKIVNTLTPNKNTNESTGQKEIRALDKQVFPQFQ